MKVLLLGAGAREHAMAKAFDCAPTSSLLCCYAPFAHPGLMGLADEWCTGDICDAEAVADQAKRWGVTLAVIGPEAPLQAGVADALAAAGIPVVGPKAALARIETSKHFARDLMQRHGIPGGPRFQFFQSMEGVEAFLRSLGENFVIKQDGLAGGKGVMVSGEHLHSIEEGIAFCESLATRGTPFLIEEKFIGQEFSLMGFSDGETVVFMPLVQDHKRAWVGDRGPNTGGMGSWSDANHSLPFLTPADLQAAKAIFQRVLSALQQECGLTWHGILYGSFIATAEGVSVIEFNARFGDPEAMNVLSLLRSDFAALCMATAMGKLAECEVVFERLATVCKYAVPEGYPDSPLKGREIRLPATDDTFYLGSVRASEGKLLTGGSRTVAVVGVAPTLAVAEALAEQQICKVEGPLTHREDIGTADLVGKRVEGMHALRLGVT